MAGSDENKGSEEQSKSLVPRKEARPEKVPETGLGLAAHAVDKLAHVLVTAIRGVLDRWVLIGVTGIVVTGVVIYSVLTGNSPDKLIELVKVLIDLVGSTFWSIGGWVSAGALAVVGGGVIMRQHRRIQQQGELLAELKDKDDPKRLSSRRDNQLHEYAAMERKKLLDKYEIVPAPKETKDTEGEEE